MGQHPMWGRDTRGRVLDNPKLSKNESDDGELSCSNIDSNDCVKVTAKNLKKVQFDIWSRNYVASEISVALQLMVADRLVTSSSPVPLKTRRVGQRFTSNLSRAETSSRWCGVVVRRGGTRSGSSPIPLVFNDCSPPSCLSPSEVAVVFRKLRGGKAPDLSSALGKTAAALRPWTN
ncbi:hypothetical protein TNCV_291591 [Trichonephila clavipes]|nr:hypothetical protein TNCV_291591 [Trichonephila clavipes]